MNPEERAEKIYQMLLKPALAKDYKDPTEFIAAQIREAVDIQDELRVSEFNEIILTHLLEKAKASAFEEAAKIAEGPSGQIFTAQDAGIRIAVKKEIAEAIRAIAAAAK